MPSEEEPASSSSTDSIKGNAAPSVETQRAEMIPWMGNYSSKRAKWNEDWPLLKRAGRFLVLIPILLFSHLVSQLTYMIQLSLDACRLAPCESQIAHLDAFRAIWGILAAILIVLLIVEFLPRHVAKPWHLPATSLTVISACILLAYPIVWAALLRSYPYGGTGLQFWLPIITCGLFFFGIGCIKLTTLKGPHVSVAIGLSFLNGFVTLMHVLLLLSFRGTV